MFKVRELDPSDSTEWDQLVNSSPQGNVFLRSEWLEMLCQTDPDLRKFTLGVYDGKGRLAGGQVVFYLSTFGMKLSVPFEFFYNGPLLKAEPNARRVSRVAEQNEILAALAQGLSDRMDTIEIEAHPNFEDGRAFQFAGWQTQLV